MKFRLFCLALLYVITGAALWHRNLVGGYFFGAVTGYHTLRTICLWLEGVTRR